MKWLPDRKVLTGGVAGLIAWALMLVLGHFKVDVPADTQTMIVGLIGWLIAYLVPPSRQDVLKRLDAGLIAAARGDDFSPSVAVAPRQ